MTDFIELGDGSKWIIDGEDQEFYAPMVAGSLSKLCRFNGHCNGFYSVAEHCVKASHLVTPEFAFEALMHDAHECLVGDVPFPIKHYMGQMPGDRQIHRSFNSIEDRAAAQMRRSFGLPETTSAEVQLADVYMRFIEAQDLLPFGANWETDPYECGLREAALSISDTMPHLRPSGWLPDRAYEVFMQRFNQVTGWERAS